MKLKLVLAIILLTLNARAGGNTSRGAPVVKIDPYSPESRAAMIEKQRMYQEQAEYEAQQAGLNAQLRSELAAMYSRDVWRRFRDVTNSVQSIGWCEFQGTAIEFKKEGIIFKGNYGKILSIRPSGPDDKGAMNYGEEQFLVTNFPYPAEEDGFGFMLAKFDGFYTYTNKTHQVIILKKFDYGTPCQKIWSPEELAAFKKQLDDRKKSISDKILKSNQDAADQGDAYGLLRMGERYRDGEGVQEDLSKAKAYLEKASAAGSETASNELSQIGNMAVDNPKN